MTCDDLDALLPEFLDGHITNEQRDAALEHLATCESCRLVVDDLATVNRLYQEHGRLHITPEARERIRRLLES
ncbi:MAG: zf-HC2 domain-containing protein [Acidimicrobiia bacterium]